MKASFAVLMVGLMVLAGCATPSTIASRRQQHLAFYNTLPPDMKAAVDAGQLKFGMPMEAVEIAWGRPSSVTSSGGSTGEAVTWIYQTTYTQETTYYGFYRVHYAYTPVGYVRAQVMFENGVVKTWQTFPPPAGY